MAQTKIERIGEAAEILVHQSKAEGKSYRTIADDIENTFNESVSHQAVKNYLEHYGTDRLAQLGAKNAQELEKQEVKKILEVGSQLEKINDKLNDALDELDTKDRQDMGIILKLSQEIRQQLKFHREFVEQVTRPDTQVTNVEINQTDVMMEFNQYLNKLQDKGAFVCDNCGHKHIKIDADRI